MEKILVSACLLGERCKYNAKSNFDARVVAFLRGKEAVAVCPETLGGLPSPRPCVEICCGRCVTRDGRDLTAMFDAGARRAFAMAREAGVSAAILQPRSPSCGVRQIYDGSFSGALISGRGVFARLLAREGIPLLEPDDLDAYDRI